MSQNYIKKFRYYGATSKIQIETENLPSQDPVKRINTSSYNEKKLKEKSYISQNTFNIAHKDKISEKTKKTIENKKGNSYQISNLRDALDSKIEQNENTNKRNPNKHNHTYYESNYRISPQLSHISKESSNKKKFTYLGDNFLQSLDNSFKLFLNDLSKSQADNNEKLVKSLSESQTARNKEFIASLISELKEENKSFINELFKKK